MNLSIIYNRLYTLDGEKFTIGGIQNYLIALSKLSQKIGWEPTIFQYGLNYFERYYAGIRIKGIPISRKLPKSHLLLYKTALKWAKRENDIVIFGDFSLSVPSLDRRTISIQHGIWWDSKITKPSFRLIRRFRKLTELWHYGKITRQTRNIVRQFNNTTYRVCVDYNFLNWYRTVMTNEPNGKIWVIPNFSYIVPRDRLLNRFSHKERFSILFPRRFYDYRGTRLMMQAAKVILSRHDNITFTFAGEGPDEKLLRKEFGGERRVFITKFDKTNATNMYLKHDIVVVPSLRSEGTSLVVAEGMGSGNVVVASNVGGLTNMIVDRFNGLLIMPTAEALIDSLEEVINKQSWRIKLSKNAYETAENAFSLEVWESKWGEVFQYIKHHIPSSENN